MTTNCTKLPQIIPNGHKIFQNIPTFTKALQNLPKFGIFGLKTNHLATLASGRKLAFLLLRFWRETRFLNRVPFSCDRQRCQVVFFHTKNPNLGIYLRALE
jgi:hypothetical protein